MASGPFSTLDVQDLGRIVTLLTHLYDLSLRRTAIRERILDAAIELVPCRGPCSIFQMNDFYSNGGGINFKRTAHRNLPLGAFGNFMVRKWADHVKKKQSIVEKALHLQNSTARVGAGRLDDLVDREEWIRSPDGRLAARFNLGDLAYLWVQCNRSDLWVIALRRYKDEATFSERDKQMLIAFGTVLDHARQSWYVDGLDRLTETEQKVLAAWREHAEADKVVAKRIGMRYRTYKTHLHNIRQKLCVQSTAEAEATLRERHLPK